MNGFMRDDITVRNTEKYFHIDLNAVAFVPLKFQCLLYDFNLSKFFKPALVIAFDFS